MSLRSNSPSVQSLSHVKRRRGGKKGVITRKINEINKLIAERGSRTKIRYLRETLKPNLSEAIALHEELMLLLDDDHEDFMMIGLMTSP